MKSIILLSLFVALFMVLGTSCKKERITKEDDCFCTLNYTPVCGENRITYGNACAAACANVIVDNIGECQ